MPTLLCLFAGSAFAADVGVLKQGDIFPDIVLPEAVNSDVVANADAAVDYPVGEPISNLSPRVLFVVVSGWFCPPCHKEIPALKALYALARKQGKDKRPIFLGISVGDGPDLAGRFVKKNGVPWPVFPDPDYALHTAMGGPLIPTLYVVDGKSMKIQRVVTGMFKHEPAAFLAELP